MKRVIEVRKRGQVKFRFYMNITDYQKSFYKSALIFQPKFITLGKGFQFLSTIKMSTLNACVKHIFFFKYKSKYNFLNNRIYLYKKINLINFLFTSDSPYFLRKINPLRFKNLLI